MFVSWIDDEHAADAGFRKAHFQLPSKRKKSSAVFFNAARHKPAGNTGERFFRWGSTKIALNGIAQRSCSPENEAIGFFALHMSTSVRS